MKKPATLPDTNVILRYLLADVPEQFTTAKEFFEKVRTGVQSAIISESVLVECLYVLTKFYGVTRTDAATNLASLLQYKGIVNADRVPLSKSLELFAATTFDPVDCILAARSAVAKNPVLTFDKALAKFTVTCPRESL
jgi:predicted nucleic-acid-binding protein